MVKTSETMNIVRSYCAQCGSLCPILCHVEKGVLIKVTADKEHPNASSLCPKGIALPELVYSPQRILYPLKRTKPKGEPDPGWERITCEEALATIASRLTEIKGKYGAEAVAFYRPGPGGSPSTDYMEWVTRFAYAFGSPNTISTTHVCQWHRDVGSAYTYGQGMPSPEFTRARLIALWGGNPDATSKAHARDIKIGMKNGARLIVVDPRKTLFASKADLWLQVRPGSDGALMLSIIQVMLERGLYDYPFVRDWTTAPFLVRGDTGNFLRGSDIFPDVGPKSYVFWDNNSRNFRIYGSGKRSPEASNPELLGTYKVRLIDRQEIECKTAFLLLKEVADQYTPALASNLTEIPVEKIIQAAEMLGKIKPACYYTFLGIEQNTNTSQTNRALCILYSLTGNYDTGGGNAIPPRIPQNSFRGGELLTTEQQNKRLGFIERPLGPPGNPGSVRAEDFYRAVLTGKPYPVKALMAFGGNLLIQNSESLMGSDALCKLDFYAQSELFMTPSAQLADMVLPAATFLESWCVRLGFSQSSNAKNLAQYRPQVIPPQGECWSDIKIIFELAKRGGMGDRFWNGDIEAAYNHILAPAKLTVEELKKHPYGIALDLVQDYKKYTQIDPATSAPRGFNTPSRKIEIYSQIFKDRGYSPLPQYEESLASIRLQPELAQKYPFTLICARTIQYCHSQGRALPSLRKAVPNPYVEINDKTARERGIQNGDWVILESPEGSLRVQARLSEKIAPQVVCSQPGWWQECQELNLPGYDAFSSDGANINLIYSSKNSDSISGSLPYKGYPCRVNLRKTLSR